MTTDNAIERATYCELTLFEAVKFEKMVRLYGEESGFDISRIAKIYNFAAKVAIEILAAEGREAEIDPAVREGMQHAKAMWAAQTYDAVFDGYTERRVNPRVLAGLGIDPDELAAESKARLDAHIAEVMKGVA